MKARAEDRENWHAEIVRQLKIFTYALQAIEKLTDETGFVNRIERKLQEVK